MLTRILSRLRTTRLLLALLAMQLVAAFAGAETRVAPAALIIDSSGSMAGREPDGQVKLDAARAVLATVLEDWPAGGDLAVLAYGHRRKSDCSDIETIVPMGPVDPRAIRAKLGDLRALGKTPLSQSLMQAAALVPDGGTIVVVSDGLETCDADPCAVAAALRNANPDLVIFVVGFGLAAEEAEELTCIAENAGGHFFDASTALDLASALNAVAETVAQLPATEPAPPEPLVAAAEPSPVPEPVEAVRVDLVAVAGALGEIVDAPVRWAVRDGGGTAVYEGEGRAVSLDLAPGNYVAEAAAANALGDAAVTVTDAQGQRHEVEVQAGRLDLSLVPNRFAPPFSDLDAAGVVWALSPLDGQAPVALPQIARPSLLLAAGRYMVRAELKGMEAEAEVALVAGAVTSLPLDFRLGTLILEATLGPDAEVISDATLIAWRVGAGDAAREIAGESRPRLVLREGSYSVALTVAGGEVAATAEVRAAEERTLSVAIEGGQLALSVHLSATSPPLEDWRDAFWTLIGEDGLAGGAVIELPEAAPVVPLAPGRWRVAVTSGTVTETRDVTIGPGTETPLPVSLDGARLTLRAAAADGGEPASNTVFTVTALGADGAAADAATYSAGAPEEVSTILRAGRWRILAEDSSGRLDRADVDLAAGEERVLDLALR